MKELKAFKTFLLTGTIMFCFQILFAQSDCIADHTVLLSDYSFTPSELTILPGESIAFINVEGIHDVNGVYNSITGTPYDNPENFYLEETTGTTEGTCMGIITLNIPGVYQYDCSVGYHAELGMIGTITVDANTISDLLNSNEIPGCFQSSYALNTYHSDLFYPDSTYEINLNGSGYYTVFLPNDIAVDAILDDFGDPEISQFDLLGFIDLPMVLRYNIVEGVYLSEDLQDGQLLPTIYGQDLTVSEFNGVFKVNDATVIATNYTADNGVVHIIDKTIAPSDLPAMSVWDIVKESENHQIFEDAIEITGYKTILRKQSEMVGNSQNPEGPFTVFAPSDAALEALAQSAGMTTIDLLYSSIIDDLVGKHIVGSINLSADIFNNQTLLNYDNESLLLTLNNDEIYVEGVQITITDLLAYNGVVHVIDAVLFEAADIPSPVGTCGTWTINMFDEEGNGWDETLLYVEVDGEIISVETGPVGNYSTFEFGVDEGDLVNLYYLPTGTGYGQSYVVEDNNNQEIISSGQIGVPGNSIGLLACPTTPTCGYIEIVMSHEYADGWWNNTLDVYRNNNLYLSIPFYYGEEQMTQVPVNDGEVFDFVYIGGQGFDPEYENYMVYAPDGTVLVDQDAPGIPQSVTGVIVCEDNTGVSNLSSEQVISIFPNPIKEFISVEAPSSYYYSDIVLYDMDGVEAHRWKSWKGELLSTENIKPGVYVLEFHGEQVIKKRVIKI